MCGLAGTLGGDRATVEAILDGVAHRGPDGRGLAEVDGAVLGHVRLSVIDPTEASAQPFRRGPVALTYNGELWNYRELRGRLEADGDQFGTAGDTEVVAAALAAWGDGALAEMDGMWALAWVDVRLPGVGLARDRFGEVPLHACADGPAWWWSSEHKGFRAAGLGGLAAVDVGPGESWRLLPDGLVERRRWYSPPPGERSCDLAEAARLVRKGVAEGAAERALACDVPQAVLVSGGVDSAAVALEITQAVGPVPAYTAVLDRRSRDLRCARLVADALGLDLVEVPVEPPTADDLARVVAEVEMPHKAQVEIGWACLALAERMRSDGVKVCYSGEGSDELWASYGMSYHGVAEHGWRGHRERTFMDQARKNFARCNKVFMARSVEVRLPFLHRPLVELALSLPEAAVRDRGRPKAVLADGYEGELPGEVLCRPKVAFQDGMGLKAACAEAVAFPARFYRAEHRRLYPGAP